MFCIEYRHHTKPTRVSCFRTWHDIQKGFEFVSKIETFFRFCILTQNGPVQYLFFQCILTHVNVTLASTVLDYGRLQNISAAPT
jgi:hypothetical protein